MNYPAPAVQCSSRPPWRPINEQKGSRKAAGATGGLPASVEAGVPLLCEQRIANTSAKRRQSACEGYTMNKRITATFVGLVLLFGPCLLAPVLIVIWEYSLYELICTQYSIYTVEGGIYLVLFLTGGLLISESAVDGIRIIGWMFFAMFLGAIVAEPILKYFFGFYVGDYSMAGLIIRLLGPTSILGYLIFGMYSLSCLERGRDSASIRCVQCGYDLRGLSEPRCLECGTPFHPPQQRRNGDRVPDR